MRFSRGWMHNYLFHFLKLLTEAFHLNVNTFYRSTNGLAYFYEKYTVLQKIYFCKTHNQISVYQFCQIQIKPGQAFTLYKPRDRTEKKQGKPCKIVRLCSSHTALTKEDDWVCRPRFGNPVMLFKVLCCHTKRLF